MKSSKHWKGTMAPMRWQGGDRAPSRNRSLLCRLILNWPDPLTGRGSLKSRKTDSDSNDRTTELSCREACFRKNTEQITNIHTESNKASPDVPNYFMEATSSDHPHISYDIIHLSSHRVTVQFHVLNRKGCRIVVVKRHCS